MMPPWLPPLIETDGEWQSVLARLYAVFCEEIKLGNLSLNGLPVIYDGRLSEEVMEEGFWHLITGFDRNTNQRLIETERACRIAWCSAVIRNADDQAILQWQYREKESLRTYLWLQTEDYVIVLQPAPRKSPRHYVLVTAFHLSGESQRRNMQRRYEKREL